MHTTRGVMVWNNVRMARTSSTVALRTSLVAMSTGVAETVCHTLSACLTTSSVTACPIVLMVEMRWDVSLLILVHSVAPFDTWTP